MFTLSNIPDLINKLSIPEREMLSLLIDNYNEMENMQLFNFFPRYLNKDKLLKQYDRQTNSKNNS